MFCAEYGLGIMQLLWKNVRVKYISMEIIAFRVDPKYLRKLSVSNHIELAIIDLILALYQLICETLYAFRARAFDRTYFPC